jgi:hypothetical protein
MNWEAVGAIGESLGAFAVLITLIYLAIQIRYVRGQVESNTLEHIVSSLNDFAGRIAESDDLADIVIRGNRSYSSLTDAEKYRYDQCFMFLLNNLESWYLQIGQLNLYATSEQSVENIRQLIFYYCNNDGFKEYWGKVREIYPHIGDFIGETLEGDV